MIELAFLGRSGDSQSVILTDAEGARYSVTITDALRTAVRRGAPSEIAPSPRRAKPRPRDIQALLREGFTSAEIAEREEIEIADVTKYEAPVLAERAWAISRAQLCKIGDAAGSPILEDLVINRLAARGVDQESLSWAALRHEGEDWEVSLSFIQSGVERQATWSLSPDATDIEALDEEAIWLTEAATPITPVSAFIPTKVQVPADEVQAVEDLVDKANAERGKPQPILEDLSDIVYGEADPEEASPAERGYFHSRAADDITPFEGNNFGSNPEALILPLNSASTDTEELPSAGADSSQELFGLAEAGVQEVEKVEPKKKGNNRRPVPSWDEIVFGSRTD